MRSVWLRAVGDLVAPRRCLVCGRTLGMREDYLCIWCEADLPLTRYASRPHNPMADRFNAVIERHRKEDAREPYAYAASLLFYHPGTPYARIPQALKYHYQTGAGRAFGSRLGRELKQAGHWSDVDLVIPVPLHWTRLFSRGYNQAEVLARAIAREIGVPCLSNALSRCRRTRTQTRLSGMEKSRNVAGAFRVRRGAFHGLRPRHILLVDDTFTTGATLYGCFAALRAFWGGPVRISVATLASVTDL